MQIVCIASFVLFLPWFEDDSNSLQSCWLLVNMCCAVQVRNASEEDINRSRLARGLAMATLLWVVCAVLGIPFKFALTLAFMAVGGMMLKEFAAGRASGGRVGGRGPHGGVKTTVRRQRAFGVLPGCRRRVLTVENTLASSIVYVGCGSHGSEILWCSC